MRKECIFIDVFTNIPYAGNQLAVFPDGRDLSTEQMQKIANEINYSETTFILDADTTRADFLIRIFTPKQELPFAGHPTLGAAYSIINIFDTWVNKKDTLRLQTKVGVIPLRKEGDAIWMIQNGPEFHRQYADKNEIADLFDLSADDIADDLPVEEVSTGNTVLIVPIKTLNAMQRSQCNVTNSKNFFASKSAGPYLFSFETTRPRANIHTRFFAPHLGILEDPATGSAAGPLIGYLLKHSVFGEAFEIVNEQGVEMGRPSEILMRGAIQQGKYLIQIGGQCAYAGQGEFVL